MKSLVPAALGAALLLTSTGCSLFRPAATGSDEAKVVADLRVQRNLLKEELAIARREQDALRALVESRPSSPAGDQARVQQLVAELDAAGRELATLRAERAAAVAPANADPARLAALESENAQLRGELGRVRSENERLAQRALTAEQALQAMNVELLAERDARADADRRTGALKAQLEAVIARSGSDPSGRLASAPASSAMSTASLGARLSPTTGAVETATATSPAPAKSERRHVVRAGDTLSSLALDYYNNVERWRDIYAANTGQLHGEKPLVPGMELVIP